MSRHKMSERQIALDLKVGDGDTAPEHSQKLDQIDVQMGEMQKGSERQYQKFQRPDLNFSDDVQFWHKRAHAWRALLGMQRGKEITEGTALETQLPQTFKGQRT